MEKKMKNIFAKVGEEIEVKPIEGNIKQCKDTLKSDLIDRMIDSLEDYLQEVITTGKTRKNCFIQGDIKTILEAFKEFTEIVYSNGNNIGVRKTTNDLTAESFRYSFASSYDKLLYYCYLMALKEEYESRDEEKNSKAITRIRVPEDMTSLPNHSSR